MAETERVVMMWPADLKQSVRDTAGHRGITEFTIKAVSLHLGVDADLAAVEKELNETKNLVQQLADQLVLGVTSPEERLQSLMEVQFPSWVDTSGWPSNFAERVRPELAEEPFGVPEPTRVEIFNEAVELAESEKAKVLLELAVEDETPMVATDEPVVSAMEDATRDDLFSRIMAKTGGKLADVPGLKLASEVKAPEKKPEPEPEPEESGLYVDDDDQAAESVAAGKCPICGEDLIDGECWTCV